MAISHVHRIMLAVALAAMPLMAQDVVLHSSVVGAGGVSHARELVTNHQLSSTIGQVFISPHVLREGLNRYEGFWVPWPSAIVSVEDQEIVAPITAYPNPFSVSTRIDITDDIKHDVEVALYSLAGLRVRSINVGAVDGANQRIELTSTDDDGVPLASGQYICQITGRNHKGARLRAYTTVTILK